MLVMVCTCIFIVAALAATSAILTMVEAYGPDVARLRLERLTRPRDRYLSWRIVEPTVPEFTGIRIDLEIRPFRSTELRTPHAPTSLAA